MANYLKVSAIKKLVKDGGRRSGKDFIEALDNLVRTTVMRAVQQESKKKTLDATAVPNQQEGTV